MPTEKIDDKRHRFPPQIIAHAVWLYAVWHLDEVQVKISGKQFWLWRAAGSMALCWRKSSSHGETCGQPGVCWSS